MKIIYRLRETVKRKYEKPGNVLFSAIRRKQLNNTDFSIICNNCWGGYVYRYFGLPYLTPTVGLYFFPDDFLKVLQDIQGYMTASLHFIEPEESAYFEELKRKGQLNVPIGKVKDVEIIFLHYKTQEEAYEKWTRRAGRINYNNIIVKFSQMNGCQERHLEKFDKLPYNKMFSFVNRPELAQRFKKAIYFKGQEEFEGLHSDTTFFNNYVDLVELINSRKFPRNRS